MLRLTRRPALTLAIVTVTAVTSAIAVSSPRVLAHLERTPAGVHGQWWRTLTSMLMQDGMGGAASNLAYMLVLGVAAEQVTTRWRWLACYLGAGIAGELAGYAWQPTGAGNSAAVCGLAGLVALACWRRDARLPGFGAFALLLWCVVLLSTWTWPAAIVGGVFAMAAVRLQMAGWRHVSTLTIAITVASGALLAGVRNIHGAALLAGLVFAGLATYQRRDPVADVERDLQLRHPAQSPR